MIAVGVLVDLPCSPQAGGQVKCWERFAHAAARLGQEIDLTVHFLGDEEQTVPIADNVRYLIHPPALSTARFRFLQPIREHTDLAPLRPALFHHLRRYDVIHTTHASFAFARTALLFASRSGTPLVHSIHTDAPQYTRIYFPQIIRGLVNNGWLSRLLVERLRFADRCAASMVRKLDRYLARCDWVLVSHEADLQRIAQVVPEGRLSFLRRGIDKATFHPRQRDRAKLHAAFGIPADRLLLLFVGRVDPVKSVMTFAQAARMLLDRGAPVHAMIVGDGSEREAIRALLGPAVTFPGILPQSTVAWLYASADLFVFPSETEVYPNVVIEAKASGLPVLVSARGGAPQCVKTPGVDGVVIEESSPARWAEAAESLRRDPEQRARMGAEARRHIDQEWPSWDEVLARDLLPVWRALAREGRRQRKAIGAA